MKTLYNFEFCIKVIVFVTLLFVNVNGKQIHQDICNNNDDRRVYIKSGETGLIFARNVSYIEHNRVENRHFGSFKYCQVELISCPACVVFINFVFLNISENCDKIFNFNSCNCDHVQTYEPPFKELSGQEFCGNHKSYNGGNSKLSFKSKTRGLVFTFLYKQDYLHAFDVEYSSERNHEVVEGSPTSVLHNNGESRFISTPYFPNPYFKDLIMEYTISCENRRETDCRVQLIFSDFLVARMSVLEVFDSDGKIMYVTTGSMFRPSAIVSSGSTLTTRFFANGASAEGFKASVTFFHRNNTKELAVKPNMNCGGLVDNLGGGITMMDMVKESTETFDCVWILKPSRNYLHFYTHFKLSVVAFSKFAGNAELYIRKGSTSAGKQAETLRYATFNFAPRQKQHIVPILQGFYIRFRGTLQPESKLALAYSAFSYNDCVPETDFLCKNQRCIPIYLQCDGFDHCGDNSDEPASCFLDLEHRRWSHTSKFLFQKNDPYLQLPTAAVVFIICCFVLGLISVLLALVILIIRVSGRVRHQRELENHMQIVNDLLEHEGPAIEEEIIIEDDPPDYENPPNYEELSKLKFQVVPDSQTEGCWGDGNNKKSGGRRKRSVNGISNSLNGNTKAIPDSPPPAYREPNYGSTQVLVESHGNLPESSEGTSSGSVQKNNGETFQNFFMKRFGNDDFGLLSKRLLQRSRKGCKSNKKNSKKSIVDLSHWLSDSDILERKTEDNRSPSRPFRSFEIKRSLSFDDL